MARSFVLPLPENLARRPGEFTSTRGVLFDRRAACPAPADVCQPLYGLFVCVQWTQPSSLVVQFGHGGRENWRMYRNFLVFFKVEFLTAIIVWTIHVRAYDYPPPTISKSYAVGLPSPLPRYDFSVKNSIWRNKFCEKWALRANICIN